MFCKKKRVLQKKKDNQLGSNILNINVYYYWTLSRPKGLWIGIPFPLCNDVKQNAIFIDKGVMLRYRKHYFANHYYCKMQFFGLEVQKSSNDTVLA